MQKLACFNKSGQTENRTALLILLGYLLPDISFRQYIDCLRPSSPISTDQLESANVVSTNSPY
jgi:hypothetical protein